MILKLSETQTSQAGDDEGGLKCNEKSTYQTAANVFMHYILINFAIDTRSFDY